VSKEGGKHWEKMLDGLASAVPADDCLNGESMTKVMQSGASMR
jgi:hypothetical protein